MKIETGKARQGLKVVLYGPEGIGKSTMAAGFPGPLFLDTEGSTAHMDVRRIVFGGTWEGLTAAVTDAAIQTDCCRTLVIDTADWAEQLCIEAVCRKYKKAGIEEFGYGKGYTYIAEEFSKLLAQLDAIVLSGRNVVITAHAKMRKFELPDEMGAYDRWEMKLSRQTAPLLKEWCDALLFLNYETFVVKSETGASKGRGGKRVMYCAHHPCWDAKNRFGLPEKADMSLDVLRPLWEKDTESGPENGPKNVPSQALRASSPHSEGAGTSPEGPLAPGMARQGAAAEEQVPESGDLGAEILRRLKAAEISPEEFQLYIANRGFFTYGTPIEQYPEDFVRDWVFKYWPNIVEAIVNDPERVPF